MANRSDNFTRADSTTTMNPPSDGGSNWVAPGGTTWGILSNQGRLVTLAGQAIIVLESLLSNVEVQCTFPVVGSDGGLVVREVDDSNYIVLKVATNALTLFTRIGGGFTQIGDAGVITVANGDVIKLRCDSADLLSVFQNGALKFSVTDASGSGNTSHGIRDNNDGVNRFSNFSITAFPPPVVGGTALEESGYFPSEPQTNPLVVSSW